MNLIGTKANDDTERFVIGEFDVGEVNIPVVSVFAAQYGEHLSHPVVHTFGAAVSTRVVCACGDIVHAKELRVCYRTEG